MARVFGFFLQLTVPGRYRLLRSTDLVNWTSVEEFEAAAGIRQLKHPLLGSTCFFQVRQHPDGDQTIDEQARATSVPRPNAFGSRRRLDLARGLYDSANDEWEKIRAEWRAHPDVLDLRWFIYWHHEQWDACLDISSAIVKMEPDRVWGWVYKAYAVRRATGGGMEKAKPVLLEAAKLFSDDSMIQYNLAVLLRPTGSTKCR